MAARIRHNSNLVGVGSLALGVVVFSLQDAIIKAISGDNPVTMAIVVRCLVALPLLLLMVHLEAGVRRLWSANAGVLLLRGAVLLVAYTTYFMSLPALPLAQAISLFFTAPLIITMLSGPLLGERVTLQGWLAVIVGFIGVLIILQPGSDVFEPAALLSLVSAATYALAMVIARRVGGTEPATVMSFYQNGVYLIGAAAAAGIFNALDVARPSHPSLEFLVRPWLMPSAWDLTLMAACGVIAAFGMFLLTHAYRLARASLVTVFEYTGMIWGPLWGFVFFGEIPSWATITGTVLIIAAGIYAVRTAADHNIEGPARPE
jgi:drug/metabolite transporter (DMT)-like permease